MGGKIQVSSTLESRLALVSSQVIFDSPFLKLCFEWESCGSRCFPDLKIEYALTGDRMSRDFVLIEMLSELMPWLDEFLGRHHDTTT